MSYKNLEKFKKENGYTIDDVWYPRVTRIISIKAKPGLHYFYASLKNYAQGEAIKKKSAEEGNRVHEAAQALMVGNNPDIKEDIKPTIKAFKKFLKERQIKVNKESIEKRVVNNKYRFAGTIDAIAEIDGKKGVLDIKTSRSIYRDYNLQTSAYLSSLKKNKDLETRWILRLNQHKVCQKCGATLRKKGGRKKVNVNWNNKKMRNCTHCWGKMEGEVELREFPSWQEDFEGFLGAKKLWEWKNKKWLKKMGYLDKSFRVA